MKRKVLSILMAAAMVLSLSVPALAADTGARHFDTVTVNADGTIDGVTGEHVTLVVDGKEVKLVPGTYTGDITVTVTDDFTVSGGKGSGTAAAAGAEALIAQESGSGEASGEASGSASGEASSSEPAEVPELAADIASRANKGDELISVSSLTDFRTAIYVDPDGLDETRSVTAALGGGTADGSGAQNIHIYAGSDSFSAIVDEGAAYVVDNADIVLDTDSIGDSVSDFSALGAAIAAYGAGTKLELNDVSVRTRGVCKPALVINAGADVIIRNSDFVVNGGTPYDTYMSNATGGTMVAPPWHLGVDNAKGNARAVNLMGAKTTETMVDSSVYAAGWGALSVDMGSYMRMDVINSTAEADNGYTVFAIGQVTENYYGSDLLSGQYNGIMMGGNINIGSYTGGDKITVKRMEAAGEGYDSYWGRETDEVITEEVSAEVPVGKTITSNVISKRFGFEMHGMMGETANGVHLYDGTTLSTGETAFIVKSGHAELSLDDTNVVTGVSPYTGDTVFLQVMDNDANFCGTTNVGAGVFHEYFWEPGGWSFEFGSADNGEWEQGDYASKVSDYGTVSSGTYGQWQVNMDLADTDVTGDLWNSTGYWSQGGSQMNVNIGSGASVTGVISSGAYQHYAKTFEVGLYGYYKYNGVALEDNAWYNSPNRESWENAKYISVVTNTPYYYGANNTAVSVTDGGVWNVTDTSFVTSLDVKGGSLNAGGIYKVTVSAVDNANAVDDVIVTACEPVAWNGSDIALSAEADTVYVVLPAGADISGVIAVGQSLGYGAEDFQAQYLGSFYAPGTAGALAQPIAY